MYIKKLISVVLMWSLVISFFAYLKPLPVCADVLWGTKIVPFVQDKGTWGVVYHGIRVYVGKDNDNGEIVKQDYGCIDILKSNPNILYPDKQILNIEENIDININYVDWQDENDINKPKAIYVASNFNSFFVEGSTGNAGYSQKDGVDYATFTVNYDICDTILRKYSNGKDGFTSDGIKNIWRLLGINQEDQEKLIEKERCYLVAEPLAWTRIPYVDNADLKRYYIYGTLENLIKFDKNIPQINSDKKISCYQLFSGIFTTSNGERKLYSTSTDNIIKGYNDIFKEQLNVTIEIEVWNLLYAMALSTSREKGDNFGKDVADIFAQYIRWYGNNYYIDESDVNMQKWYYVHHATDIKRPENGNGFVSEDTIRELYDDILNQGYYRIKCKTDILVSTVDGPYTTDSDVYTTVNIKNISGNDINIGNITSQFSASYPIEIIDSSGTNAFNTTHLADKETACVSIKWHTPADPANIHFTADIYQENNDPTAVIVSPVEFDVLVENQKSEEDYSNIGADISDVFAVNKKIKETYDSIYSSPYYDTTIKENIGRWQKEYGLDENNKYHSGAVYAQEFVKDNQLFQNSLNFNGYPLDIRSYISGNQKISDRDTVKSGYGIGLSLDYNGNDMMTYKSAKLIILYPEYGYDMKYASVADYSEIYNRYILKSSPVSSYGSDNEKSRVHFIPEWWQNNTEYKIYWVLTDMWTPSGEVCTWGEISLNIDGSFYDDWYITRNIGDD